MEIIGGTLMGLGVISLVGNLLGGPPDRRLKAHAAIGGPAALLIVGGMVAWLL